MLILPRVKMQEMYTLLNITIQKLLILLIPLLGVEIDKIVSRCNPTVYEEPEHLSTD